MSILKKLEEQTVNKVALRITPQEYQALCLEIFDLGDRAYLWDDLVLNYRYNNELVTVTEEEIQ